MNTGPLTRGHCGQKETSFLEALLSVGKGRRGKSADYSVCDGRGRRAGDAASEHAKWVVRLAHARSARSSASLARDHGSVLLSIPGLIFIRNRDACKSFPTWSNSLCTRMSHGKETSDPEPS